MIPHYRIKVLWREMWKVLLLSMPESRENMCKVIRITEKAVQRGRMGTEFMIHKKHGKKELNYLMEQEYGMQEKQPEQTEKQEYVYISIVEEIYMDTLSIRDVI